MYVAELAMRRRMEFPLECIERCSKLRELLSSTMHDTELSRQLIGEQLADAVECEGPKKRRLGGLACKSV
jgi:hypothetical protein